MPIPDVKRVMMPEFSDTSDTTYEMYPMQKIIIHSITGFLENIRNLLRTYALSKANITPINNELHAKPEKSVNIYNGVSASISLLLYVNLSTVLNKMIDTASLVIPSPKTILNNFGCFS